MDGVACEEIWEIIEQLGEEDRNKIPKEIIETIDRNRDKYYNANIDLDIPLEEQKISEKAVDLLCYINLEYLSTPEEKEELIKIYSENERRLSEELDVYKIFEKRKNKIENLPVEIKPKKWYERIFEKLKRLLKKT